MMLFCREQINYYKMIFSKSNPKYFNFNQKSEIRKTIKFYKSIKGIPI